MPRTPPRIMLAFGDSIDRNHNIKKKNGILGNSERSQADFRIVEARGAEHDSQNSLFPQPSQEKAQPDITSEVPIMNKRKKADAWVKSKKKINPTMRMKTTPFWMCTNLRKKPDESANKQQAIVIKTEDDHDVEEVKERESSMESEGSAEVEIKEIRVKLERFEDDHLMEEVKKQEPPRESEGSAEEKKRAEIQAQSRRDELLEKICSAVVDISDSLKYFKGTVKTLLDVSQRNMNHKNH